MAEFAWTTTGTGDWSDPSNWALVAGIGTPPPGVGDVAIFGNLSNSYTVTVQAGSTVGGTITGPFINIDLTSLIGAPTFSISGTLTADIIYHTDPGDPATGMSIEPGGLLYAPILLFSVDVPETVTISGTGAGGRLELGDLTVGGFVSGFNSLMTMDFANAGPMALNTGVIQFDDARFCSVPLQPRQSQTSGWVDEFVVPGDNFTGDTVTYDRHGADGENAGGTRVHDGRRVRGVGLHGQPSLRPVT